MKDDLVEQVAEGIWQAEWARAGNGGRRRIPWSEVAEVDQGRYRFVAEAVLKIAVPAILEEAAQVARRLAYDAIYGAVICHGEMPTWEIGSEADDIAAHLRSLAHTTGQEG